MDNYYTSTTLFKDLCADGFEACGTMRSNRRGILVDIRSAKPQKGECHFSRDDSLLFMKWKDKREVLMPTYQEIAYQLASSGYACVSLCKLAEKVDEAQNSFSIKHKKYLLNKHCFLGKNAQKMREKAWYATTCEIHHTKLSWTKYQIYVSCYTAI